MSIQRNRTAQCVSKGVGLSIAKSIRGHQLVWHVGEALPENRHVARCSRYCKLAPTDLNTFGGQQTKKQGDGNFPLAHSNVRHFTGRMWNKRAEVGMSQKKVNPPFPPFHKLHPNWADVLHCGHSGSTFWRKRPRLSLSRSLFFTHTSLSFSVASQLWIGQLCWNMSLESRLLILFYFF